MSDIVKSEPQTQELQRYNREQIDLIKETVAKGTTDNEFALFMYTAERAGLDPLAKQIHCVKRFNKKTGREDMSIQVAIDGYRLIADRTGRYAGSDDYLFNEGLTEFQHIDQYNCWPLTATVTVYKLVGGVRCPFTATARWDEYYPGEKQGFMWNKMPYLMLGKCAEALALRKAFPAELSGMYTREEMEQAELAEVVDTQPRTAGKKEEAKQDSAPTIISFQQAKRFKKLAAENGWSEAAYMQLLEKLGFKSHEEITRNEYNRLCLALQNHELREKAKAKLAAAREPKPPAPEPTAGMTGEEVRQSIIDDPYGTGQPTPAAAQASDRITSAQVDELTGILRLREWSKGAVVSLLSMHGFSSMEEITPALYSKIRNDARNNALRLELTALLTEKKQKEAA